MLFVDFLPKGFDDSPIIRIQGYDGAASKALQERIEALAFGRISECEMENIEGVQCDGGFRVLMATGKRNLGVVPHGDSGQYRWTLTPSEWESVAGLLEPFLDDQSREPLGSQWLDDSSGTLVLFSPSGQW